MANALKKHIKSHDYRDSVQTFMIHANESFTIYSPHWINRLRLNNTVRWMCFLTGL